MDPITLVVTLVGDAIQEAPAIIAAIQAKGGTVAQVGPTLTQDAATIQQDINTLEGEQDPPAV